MDEVLIIFLNECSWWLEADFRDFCLHDFIAVWMMCTFFTYLCDYLNPIPTRNSYEKMRNTVRVCGVRFGLRFSGNFAKSAVFSKIDFARIDIC